MAFVSAFISNKFCQAVTFKTRFIGQNARQVREKKPKFSGFEASCHLSGPPKSRFLALNSHTQRRIIKDVQILAYTKKIKAQCYPKYISLDQKQFFRVGKNMSAISRKLTFSVGNLENFE